MTVVVLVGPESITGRDVRHAIAPDWPGPLCNLGIEPARKRITGVLSRGTVTCWECLHTPCSSP